MSFDKQLREPVLKPVYQIDFLFELIIRCSQRAIHTKSVLPHQNNFFAVNAKIVEL